MHFVYLLALAEHIRTWVCVLGVGRDVLLSSDAPVLPVLQARSWREKGSSGG